MKTISLTMATTARQQGREAFTRGEARVPFLDKTFWNDHGSIDPDTRLAACDAWKAGWNDGQIAPHFAKQNHVTA